MKNFLDMSKIKPAQEVLKRVMKANGLPKDVFFVDTYQNCREAGYCIRGSYYLHENGTAFKGGEIYVAFSEYRNSDNIVVYIERDYTGNKSLYEGFHGNIPSEEAYRNSVSFMFGDYDGAAQLIINELTVFVALAKNVAKRKKESKVTA